MAGSLHHINMRRLVLSFLFISLSLGMGVAQAQAPQVAISAGHSPYGEKLLIAGVPNAGRITDQLYRGGQPRIASIAQLKELGITTIVDLRGEDVGMRDQERKEAESLGIHFVSIPIGGWSPPTSDQVTQFLSLLGGRSNERVFVHCRRGVDRTGVFVATYRMAAQKWTVEQAMNEMYFFGFNGFWHRAMSSYIRNFPALLSSSSAFAKLSNSNSSASAPVPLGEYTSR